MPRAILLSLLILLPFPTLSPASECLLDAVPSSGAAPLSVAFTASGLPNGVSWDTLKLVPGDGGAAISLIIPKTTYTYATPGTYNAVFTAVEAGGASTWECTKQIVVEAGAPPLGVSLTATPSSGASPLAVNFTTAISGGTSPYTYAWDFGDGETGTGENPSHSYSTSGTHTAKVTVTDSKGKTADASTTVTVTESLTVSLQADSTSGVSPLEVNFTTEVSGGTAPYAYAWDFGDGENGTGENPSHHYATAGTHAAKVTVTDSKGTKADASITITVTTPPLSVLLNADTWNGPPPLEVKFTAEASGGTGPYTYSWAFGDGGNGTGETPAHSYTTAGEYTATVTVTDSESRTAEASMIVAVTEIIPLGISLHADNLTGTTPMIVNFTTLAEGGTTPYSYSWDFGDGETGAGAESFLSHTYSKPGLYTATVTLTDSKGQTVSASENLSVVEIEPLSIFLGSNTISGASPLAVDFTLDVSGGTAPYTYSWEFGDGETGKEVNPSHLYKSDGSYICTVTVTDASGANLSESIQITVISLASMEIIPSEILLTQPGAEMRLSVQGYLSDGTWTAPSDVKWESSDPAIARMEEDRVIAVKSGTAQITAISGSITATVPVVVNFEPVSIEFSESLVFMRVKDKYTPKVIAVYADGGSAELTDYTLSVTEGTDSIQIQGKDLTALKGGFVRVACKLAAGSTGVELSAELLIDISEPTPLNISPSLARVKPGETVVVSIEGGVPPYQVEKGTLDGSGLQWNLTAPDKAGEYPFTVKDASGTTALLTLQVLAPLKLNFSGDPTPAPGAAVKLVPSGGTPPYSWFATAGNLSKIKTYDTRSVTYTTPPVAGIYTVTLTDAYGQSFDLFISTVSVMVVSPKQLYLSPKEDGQIQIIGGKAPYSAFADAGVLKVNNPSPVKDAETVKGTITDAGSGAGTTMTYTAPPVAGNYMITIRDRNNTSRQIQVKVANALWVSPKAAYLGPEKTKTFGLTGGVGKDKDIFIKARRGEVPAHPTDKSFTYKAPAIAGSDTIVISDMSGRAARVDIEVTSNYFFVTPANETLLRGETRVFRTVGGSGDKMVWKAGTGDLAKLSDADSKKEQNIQYKAAERIGSDSLTATDMEGKTASANIHVISDNLLLTPRQVYLKPGEKASLRALFGTGEYEFIVSEGSFTLTGKDKNTSGKANEKAGNEIEYTPPGRSGEYFVTVFDSAGNQAKTRVTVSGGTTKPIPPKAALRDIQAPSAQPDSQHQPMAVGDVQKGGKRFNLSADFPNYQDATGKPVSMNYYLLLLLNDYNLWFVFDAGGGIHPLNELRPFASKMTDMVYTSLFQFDYCADIPINGELYALAIESAHDPNENLMFDPADAPFEVWRLKFTFNLCK